MVAEESRGRKGDLGETGLAGEEATVEKKMRRETGYKEESPVLDAGRVEEMDLGADAESPRELCAAYYSCGPWFPLYFRANPCPAQGIRSRT